MFLKSLSQVLNLSIQKSKPQSLTSWVHLKNCRLKIGTQLDKRFKRAFRLIFWNRKLSRLFSIFFGLHSNAFLSRSCNVENHVVSWFRNSRFQKAISRFKKEKRVKNEPGERERKLIGRHVHHNRADFWAIGVSVRVFRLFRAASFPIFFIEAVVKSHVFSFKRLNTGLSWFGSYLRQKIRRGSPLPCFGQILVEACSGWYFVLKFFSKIW